MPRLVASKVVMDPEKSSPVVLAAGDELPPWARGLVGGHLLTDDAPDGPGDGEAGVADSKPRARRTSKD